MFVFDQSVQGLAIIGGIPVRVTRLKASQGEAPRIYGQALASPAIQWHGYTFGQAQVCPALSEFAELGQNGELKPGPNCEACSCSWSRTRRSGSTTTKH